VGALDDPSAPKKFNPFIFLPPALCDMTATSIQATETTTHRFFLFLPKIPMRIFQTDFSEVLGIRNILKLI
jgi:hypothetical protein